MAHLIFNDFKCYFPYTEANLVFQVNKFSTYKLNFCSKNCLVPACSAIILVARKELTYFMHSILHL
jgi:hypothetical protein